MIPSGFFRSSYCYDEPNGLPTPTRTGIVRLGISGFVLLNYEESNSGGDNGS